MRTHRLAQLVLAGITGAGCLLAVSGAAAAAEVQPRATHHITHIHCTDQEDVFGADDPYMLIDGRQVWGEQMTAGDDRDTPYIAINDGSLLTLNEADYPDPDDTLGADRIHGAGVYYFKNDGANYSITVV